MDSARLLSGLAFLALISTAWGVSRLVRPRPAWWAFCVFACAQALYECVGGPWSTIPEATVLPALSQLTLAMSLLALTELARCLAAELTGKAPGVWLHAVLVGATAGLIYIGSLPMPVALWAVLGGPAVLGGAWGLWRLSKNPPTLALPLRWVATGLVIGGVGAAWPDLAGHRWPVLSGTFGLGLAALAKAFGTVLMAAGMWRCYWELKYRDYPSVPRHLIRQHESFLAFAWGLVLLANWAGARQLTDAQAAGRREQILGRIAVAAAVIDADRLNELLRPPPAQGPNLAEAVETQLEALRRAEPDFKAGWLTWERGNVFKVLAASPPAEPGDLPAGIPRWAHPAGRELQQPRPAKAFLTKAHEEDGHVTAVAGFPFRETTDRTIWLLWLVDADAWARQAVLARLPAHLVALLLGGLLLVFNALWHHSRLLSEARRRDLERTRRQEAAIAKLASSQMLAADSFATAAAFITGVAAETQQAERVSIWLGGPREGRIRCVDLYELTPQQHQTAPDILAADCPSYFAALSASELIVASEAMTDPRLHELAADYLKPLRITALLDAPIFAEGTLAGVVCFEHMRTPRRWLEDEARFASEIADQVAFALVSARRQEAEAALAASEEHFREFVEVLPLMVFELDLKGRFTFVNQATSQTSGYSTEELLAGLSPLDLCDPVHHEAIQQSLTGLLEGGGLVRGEYRMHRKDGSVFMGLAHVSAMHEGGMPVGYRGVVLDITERKRAEVAARDSQRRLAEILDFLPDPTFVIDQDRRVVVWNRAVETLTGVPASRMVGRGNHEYALPFYGQRRPILIDLVTEPEDKLRSKYTNLRWDGDNLVGEAFVPGVGQKGRHLWGSARPLYDAEGRFAGAIESIRDVSARRRAEEALRQTHTELARTCESMKDLLKKQAVDIHLAHQALWLVNSSPPRRTPLPDGTTLFVTSLFLPCHAAGGDHFFVRTLDGGDGPGGRTVLSLKDQSGHEVGCILRSIVTDLLHNALLHQESGLGLAQVIGRLNREIQASGFFGEGEFFTAMNLALNHATRELEFLSAGHPPLLLIRGRQVIALPEAAGQGSNFPVGLLENIAYEAGRCQLQTGDKLLCYTDGLCELPVRQGLPALTPSGLSEVVSALAAAQPEAPVSELVFRLLERLGLFEGDGGRLPQGLTDDVALLGLEVEAPGAVQELALQPRRDDELNQMVRECYERLRQEWAERGFEKPDNRLRIVLEEALVNAWIHGNQRDPGRRIHLRWWYANDATIEVTDEGRGFDHSAVSDPRGFENLSRPSGRGLHIIRLLSTETTWQREGRRLTISFARRDHPSLKPKRPPSRHAIDLWGRPAEPAKAAAGT